MLKKKKNTKKTLTRREHINTHLNLPCNAGDVGSIPGPGTKIPHATGKLSLCMTTTEPVCHNWRAHVPQQLKHACPRACAP